MDDHHGDRTVVQHGRRHRAQQGAGDASAATGAHAEHVERLLAQQRKDLLGRVAVPKHGGDPQVLRERRGDLAQPRRRLGLHLIGELP
jgi:hypothetical protein